MSILLRRPAFLCHTCYRAFASTAIHPAQVKPEYSHPQAISTEVPPYPYGPAQWYKQSDRGLYGGQRIRFGNNVGPKSKFKTRRTWAVNVQRKRIWSKALNDFVRLKVTTRVLRTIDKVGGLDEYLLGDKESRIRGLGLTGWKLRWAIMQTPAIRTRFEQERESLGLPGIEEELKTIETEIAALQFAQGGAEGEEHQLVEEPPQEADPTDPDAPKLKTRPLKLRLQPYKHVVLTKKGWKPPQRDAKTVAKNKIVQEKVDAGMRVAEPIVLERLSQLEISVTEQERTRALRRTRDRIEKNVLKYGSLVPPTTMPEASEVTS